MRFIDSPFVSIQSEAHLDSFFAAAKPAKKLYCVLRRRVLNNYLLSSIITEKRSFLFQW